MGLYVILGWCLYKHEFPVLLVLHLCYHFFPLTAAFGFSFTCMWIPEYYMVLPHSLIAEECSSVIYSR